MTDLVLESQSCNFGDEILGCIGDMGQKLREIIGKPITKFCQISQNLEAREVTQSSALKL